MSIAQFTFDYIIPYTVSTFDGKNINVFIYFGQYFVIGSTTIPILFDEKKITKWKKRNDSMI